MPGLIWSPAALLDVQRLYRFLEKKNLNAAKHAIHTIREGVRILAKQPEVGRPTEDMEPEYREWPINFGDTGHIALYHYGGQTAVILAIRHQKKAGYKSG